MADNKERFLKIPRFDDILLLGLIVFGLETAQWGYSRITITKSTPTFEEVQSLRKELDSGKSSDPTATQNTINEAEEKRQQRDFSYEILIAGGVLAGAGVLGITRDQKDSSFSS